MAKFPTKPQNPYRYMLWLGVAILIGSALFYVFVISPQWDGSVKPPPSNWMSDVLWAGRVRSALKQTGVTVYDVHISDNHSQGGEREVNVTVSDVVDGQHSDPYILVSAVHLMIAAGYSEKQTPEPVDWVTVNVYPEAGDQYLVRIQYQTIDLVVQSKISEKQYLDEWQASPNAPDFNVPKR